MLRYINTKDIKYKGQLFRGRKIIGTEETLALIYPLRDKAIFVSGWRSKTEQEVMVKKGASKTMDSNHRRGVAYDIWNWSEMEASMRKLGFINDISLDKNHFPLGGEAKARKNYKIIDFLPNKLEEYKPKNKPAEKKKGETTSTPIIMTVKPLSSISEPTTTFNGEPSGVTPMQPVEQPMQIIIKDNYMKSLFQSRTFWLAVVQGVAGILVIAETQFPTVGMLVIVKSLVDIMLRTLTITEIK
jgi:hypothetical protein